jgi:hypothetical protein
MAPDLIFARPAGIFVILGGLFTSAGWRSSFGPQDVFIA